MANKDIELLFGVAGGGSIASGSGKQIKDDIDSIISQINQRPLEIKIAADKSNVDGFKKELESLTAFAKKEAAKIQAAYNIKFPNIPTAPSGGGPGNPGGGGGGKGSNNNSNLKPYLDAYREMLALMRLNKSANNATTESYKGLKAQSVLFRDALELQRRAAISIEDAFLRMGTSGATALNGARESVAKLRAEMEHAGQSGTVTEKQLYDTVSKMQAALDNSRAFASGTDSFNELNGQMSAWATAAENVRNGSMTVEEAMAGISTAGLSAKNKIAEVVTAISSLNEQTKTLGLKESYNQNIKAEADAYKETADATEAYYKILTKVKTSKNDISYDVKSNKYLSESGEYAKLADELNLARDSYMALYRARAQLSSDNQARYYELLTDEIRKYNLALEAQANKEREAARAKAERERAKSDAKDENNAYKDAVAAVKKYHAVLAEVKTTENDVARMGQIYVSESGDWNGLAKSLTDARDAYVGVFQAIKTLSPEHQQQVWALIRSEVEKYNLALEAQTNKEKEAAKVSAEKLQNMSKRMGSLLSGNKNASNLASYAELEKFLNDFNSKIFDAEGNLLSAEQIIKNFGTTGASAIAQAEEKMSALNAEIEKTGQSGNTSQRQVVDLAAKMKAAIEANKGNSDVSTTGSYTSLTDEYAKINNVIREVERNHLSLEAAFQKVYGAGVNIASVFEKARTALSSFQHETAGSVDEMALYHVVVKKIDTALVSAKGNLEKWTAANSGGTKEDYTAIKEGIDALEEYQRQLSGGTRCNKELAAAVEDVINKINHSSAAIKTAGKDTQSWGDHIKSLLKKFGSWFGISQIFMKVVGTAKKMVEVVVDIDTAMTELRKVTDETDATYTRFLDGAGDRAKKLGATLTDVVEATANFARLGKSLSDSSVLADVAIMYKNIGDGIDDINQATESLISTMQAFGLQTSDAQSVIDKFNEVGNTEAITSAGIGDALQRSAAAMHAANNSLDETIALIAAANTIVQNPDSVGK